MKIQQNKPPPPQHAARTNLALAPLPWPGAFHCVMCFPSNCKRMGCSEGCWQKTGTVVWGDITLGLGGLHLLGGDALGPSLLLQCQPKYPWPRQHLPAHSWAGPNEEAKLVMGGLGAPYATVTPSAGCWETMALGSSPRLPRKLVQNRKRSPGFSGSHCQISFPILVSPLWSLSTVEPGCLAITGQWV